MLLVFSVPLIAAYHINQAEMWGGHEFPNIAPLPSTQFTSLLYTKLIYVCKL